MSVCERLSASLGVYGKLIGVETAQINGTLTVPELSNVIVLDSSVDIWKAAPAQEHVARCLHCTLSSNHAMTVLPIYAAPQKALERGFLSFLYLQHERIILVGAAHHYDPCAQAHASDAYDLVGHVDSFIGMD